MTNYYIDIIKVIHSTKAENDINQSISTRILELISQEKVIKFIWSGTSINPKK